MSHSDKNKQTVLSSAIVAKATVKRNGRINIIVVFQESTRHEFYWVFQAKSARSARRSWRYMCHYGRDLGNMDFKPYRDFGSFVDHYARINHSEVLAVRVLHARRMATLLTATTKESIHSDWTPQDVTHPHPPSGTSPKWGERQFGGRGRGGFYFNQRNRANDEMQVQSANEVFVYDDWCEECDRKHAFAHYADGKKLCKVGYLEMKKNPGLEYQDYTPARGYRFTYRSFAGVGA